MGEEISMGGQSKGQMSKEQKSRMMVKLQEELSDLLAKNSERVNQIVKEGVPFSPMTVFQANIQVLVDHVCATDYARVRYELAVQKKIQEALSEGNVSQAKSDIATQQEKMRQAMAAAEAGRTETGLYVPQSASEVAAVTGASGEPAVQQEPTDRVVGIRPKEQM